jgi:outer membrane receptor for ferrienterochelin and colicin
MKQLYLFLYALGLLLISFSLAAQTSLKGTVLDQKTKEPLAYAVIFAGKNQQIAVYADDLGFYQFTVPKDEKTITASYVGYESVTYYLDSLDGGGTVNFSLPSSVLLPTVEVVGQSKTFGNTTSILTPSLRTLAQTPSLLGEVDLLKSLTLLPGISAGVEGTSGIQIRGGNANQTHLLIDGIPMYNVNHIGGFLSAIPDFGVKGITVFKGGVPPRYGGRLSGVLDILLREGRRDKISQQYTIGLGTLQGGIEGPSGKRGSFLLNARAAWPTLLGNIINSGNYQKGQDGSHRTFALYDFLGKYVFQKNNTKLTLSAFSSGDDGFAQDDLDNGLFLDEFNWRNTALALQFRQTIGQKSVLHGALQWSNYTYTFAGTSVFPSIEGEYRNFGRDRIELKDWSANVSYSYKVSNAINTQIGLQATQHEYDTQILEKFNSPVIDTMGVRAFTQSALESSAFWEGNLRTPNEKLLVTGGLRVSSLFNNNQQFINLEPRLRVSWQLIKNVNLNAGYDKHTQYLHQLTTDVAIFPNDIWLIADNNNLPETAEQVYLGLGGTLGKGIELQWSAEVFYKTTTEQIRVLPGRESSLTLSNTLDEIIARNGQGRSKGLELFVNQQGERLQYWVAYTLSFSDRQYAQINDGEWFPFTFDRRHDISIQSSYQVTEKWLLSTNFVYQTGYSFTAPITTARLFDIYSTFNNARLPAFHRLNLGASRQWTAKRNESHLKQLTFSVYNAYNRANPFSVEVNPVRVLADPNMPSGDYYLKLQTFTRSLFPLIPSVSYKVSFN